MTISSKEFYCLHRAHLLQETLGLTFTQGYKQAKREWNRDNMVPKSDNRREEEYDYDNKLND